MARIKITGFNEAKVIEDVFASSMVDVAYIDEITTDAIYIVGDVGIDFEKPTDFKWIKEIIEDTLAQYNVMKFEITLQK